MDAFGCFVARSVIVSVPFCTMQIVDPWDFPPSGYSRTLSCPASIKCVRWLLKCRHITFTLNRSLQIWLRLLHYFLMISSTSALNINPILSSTAVASFDLVHYRPHFLQLCPTRHPADTTTHIRLFGSCKLIKPRTFPSPGRRPWCIWISPCAGAWVVEVFFAVFFTHRHSHLSPTDMAHTDMVYLTLIAAVGFFAVCFVCCFCRPRTVLTWAVLTDWLLSSSRF